MVQLKKGQSGAFYNKRPSCLGLRHCKGTVRSLEAAAFMRLLIIGSSAPNMVPGTCFILCKFLLNE